MIKVVEKAIKGWSKDPIQRIDSQDDLYTIFSKYHQGLYKNASELCTLCGFDVGIIIFSPTNNPFSFWHPSMESIIERYRNPDQPLISDYDRVVETNVRAKIEHLNRHLDEVLNEKEQIKDGEKQLDEIDKTREKGWWEQISLESLNKEQVKEWKTFFKTLVPK
ncbi:hypothetical protein DH2020_019690 [Rehmannia glutinosa]|uniref:MADS-box domain-containing protein n=1 Tax=Rehmannia glutinosa TaxID=99300 RepID=A0ABR0WDX4_REHGL